jgi:hypothetical protein
MIRLMLSREVATVAADSGSDEPLSRYSRCVMSVKPLS